jgi:hypothetical protein
VGTSGDLEDMAALGEDRVGLGEHPSPDDSMDCRAAKGRLATTVGGIGAGGYGGGVTRLGRGDGWSQGDGRRV